MKHRNVVAGVLSIAVGLVAVLPLSGQLPEYPLAPLKPSGDLIAPYFDGWYDNGDGSVTFSFGFMNRNTEEIVDIPLGPNNFIEPAQFDGVQPTHFPVYDRRGFQGKRERGAFAVTVPADMAGTEVWWTLSHAGHTYSIPGRATSPAYELSRRPAANGSLPPAVRFGVEGHTAMGREGLMAERVTASVGTPVVLSVLVQDRGEREGGRLYPVGTTWIRHQGPAAIRFEPEGSLVESEGWGESTTQATFTEPGEYVVRVRVDNFEADDSQFDDQCCWSNAYIPVTVTRDS